MIVEVPEVGPRLHEDHAPLRIWDSLFLDALALHDLPATRNWGLLLHYLPSENPTLDSPERLRLASVEARVAAAATLVIVTGEGLQTVVPSVHPHRRVFVCEPGVSAPFLTARKSSSKRPHDKVALLSVANMVPAKGLRDMLPVLERVRDVDWEWHVVGDRSIDAEYTRCFDREAKRLGLETRMCHHGALDHTAIAKVMASVDLFVSFSRYEAYGMALAEAAAMGLPAVTTDVGAARRIYQHGVTGLLGAPADVSVFAAYLERLMKDATLRGHFRDNLRLHKARTWDDALADFLAATAGLEQGRMD